MNRGRRSDRIFEHRNDYPWSSRKGYVSSAKKWNRLHKDFIVSLLTNLEGDRLQAYKQFMKMGDSEEITQVFESKKWLVFLGYETFGSWLKGTFFEQNNDAQIPASKVLAPDLETIQKTVCSYYGVAVSDIALRKEKE